MMKKIGAQIHMKLPELYYMNLCITYMGCMMNTEALI